MVVYMINKAMMLFVGIVLLTRVVAGLFAYSNRSRVRIGYEEYGMFVSSQCVDKKNGAFPVPAYQLLMAYSQTGKVSYKILNESLALCNDTVLRLQMAVEQSTNIRHVLH